MIESTIACGIGHFIYSSSAQVYGDQQIGPIPETAQCLPSNAYASSKLMTETMLADIAKAHAMNFCTLRFFNVAGADSAGRNGATKASVPHLIRQALETVIGWRAEVVIQGTDFETPDGTAIRDYIHVSDVASAHVAALEAVMASPGCNLLFNCGGGVGHSELQILAAVERITNVRIARSVASRQAHSPDELVADCNAIQEALDWRPIHSDIDQIIRDAYRLEARIIQQTVDNSGSEASRIDTSGRPRSGTAKLDGNEEQEPAKPFLLQLLS